MAVQQRRGCPLSTPRIHVSTAAPFRKRHRRIWGTRTTFRWLLQPESARRCFHDSHWEHEQTQTHKDTEVSRHQSIHTHLLSDGKKSQVPVVVDGYRTYPSTVQSFWHLCCSSCQGDQFETSKQDKLGPRRRIERMDGSHE